MRSEVGRVFKDFDLKGLGGNPKVEEYYAKNAAWVQKILKWDILGLHKVLPASVLVKPYNFITNLMRKDLNQTVIKSPEITTADFFIQTEDLDKTLDIYVVARKPSIPTQKCFES
jgi:hypothetical protein